MGPSVKLIKHVYHIFVSAWERFFKKKKKKKKNPSDFKMNSSTKAACTLTPICDLSAVTDWSMNESDPKACWLFYLIWNKTSHSNTYSDPLHCTTYTLRCKFCAWCNTDCFGVWVFAFSPYELTLFTLNSFRLYQPCMCNTWVCCSHSVRLSDQIMSKVVKVIKKCFWTKFGPQSFEKRTFFKSKG